MRVGREIGEKESRLDEQTWGAAVLRVEGWKLFLMASTLLIKNAENSTHLAGDTSRVVLGGGQIIEFMVLKRVLGL